MREMYHEQLASVIADLVSMTRGVQEATRQATAALLSADTELAERVIGADAHIDRARESIEDQSFEILALQQPVAGDLRMLVAALRMVADLERMGDLAVHVAKITRMRYPDHVVPPSAEPVIAEMADVAHQMVQSVAEIVANRDVEAAAALEREDEVMDELRVANIRMLLSESWAYGVEPAIDMALLGRYYERIADHAVSMARRVVYLVTGEHPVPAA
jgi:phosphate transport system protein